jgi:hypothetical protein
VSSWIVVYYVVRTACFRKLIINTFLYAPPDATSCSSSISNHHCLACTSLRQPATLPKMLQVPPNTVKPPPQQFAQQHHQHHMTVATHGCNILLTDLGHRLPLPQLINPAAVVHAAKHMPCAPLLWPLYCILLIKATATAASLVVVPGSTTRQYLWQSSMQTRAACIGCVVQSHHEYHISDRAR